MDFGSIIKRSWQITWRYKGLWVLGIFAGVSGCQAGGTGNGGGGGGDLSRVTDGSMPDFRGFLDVVQEWLPALVAAAVLLTLIGLVWAVFGIAARGGLIVGVDRIERGGSPALGALWSAGFARFWPLLGLDILLRLPVYVVLLAVMLGVFAPLLGALAVGRQPGAEVVAPICGSVAIGIPLLIVLSFVLGIMELVAKRYLMLGGQGVFEAAGNSWRFFRARFKDTFLMWLINAGLNIAASFALIIPGFIIGIVVAVPAVMAIAGRSWEGLVPVVLLGTFLIMLLSLAYAAIWGTFTSTLWTLFFRRVTGMEPLPVATPQAVPAGYSPVAGPPAYEPPRAPEQVVSPPPAPPMAEYPQNPPQPPAPGV